MNSFIKNYKAIIFGLLIASFLTILLHSVDFILINSNAIAENLTIFLFWWLIFSIGIHNVSFFKENKNVTIKIIGLVALLILTVFVDTKLEIPDNPITITLIVVFWIGICYLLAPKFFNKYKLPILILYGIILTYFIYVRFGYDTTSYFNDHKESVVGLLLIPIPVIFLLYLFEQWKWLKNLKSKKDKAELALLKSQVNPHFFFNTLNNLYGLTVEKSDDAPEVVLKLSDMMRYTIYEGKKDYVSLNAEITYLENYIELHKIRFQKKVDIKFNHSIEKDYEVAPLLFIILLENAFKHGIESLAQDAYIDISLKASSKRIIFSIENNFDPKSTETENGIGLTNLKERLHLLYPKKHILKIEENMPKYKATLELEIS
jgi:hypothetical protein